MSRQFLFALIAALLLSTMMPAHATFIPVKVVVVQKSHIPVTPILQWKVNLVKKLIGEKKHILEPAAAAVTAGPASVNVNSNLSIAKRIQKKSTGRKML